ncbi:TPA: hypothetical protein ACOJPH_005136 [Vibrio campbellii]|uniref:hypothetical protein n=1 Tax=Vibrio campbellii TaxID=680 RepID=UPI000682E7B9|nr:hypothetical protein [Vibrio campbellii]
MFADQFKSNAVVFEVTAIANLIAGHLVIKRFAVGAVTGRTFKSVLIGGTVSVLTGGKFQNGAVSAAFSRMLNDGIKGFSGDGLGNQKDIRGLPRTASSQVIGLEGYWQERDGAMYEVGQLTQYSGVRQCNSGYMVVCTVVGYHNPDKIGSEAVIDVPGLSESAEVLSFTSEVTNNNRIRVIIKFVVESNRISEAINNISKLDM